MQGTKFKWSELMKKYIFATFVVILSVTCFASYSFGIDTGKKISAADAGSLSLSVI